ncbi:HNH endonuclease, partial [Enterobacter sp. SECR19-1250]|uniref:HNH endonuclease n=1 Tax=Enterobacter sp. SECR19-1250 TaxID=2749084 RepID=UPI0015B41211
LQMTNMISYQGLVRTFPKGKCQSCKRDAPFLKEDGTPFLEVHHIEWLSKGGEDSVENAIALCPNCHRQAHYGALELVAVNKQG